MKIDSINLDSLILAANSSSVVSGYTHDFYNYPARFSPLFAREVIRTFTQPGDLILDPFMGGGTTLVEAKALGRRSIGFDISSLACFIAKVKTTILSSRETSKMLDWSAANIPNLKCEANFERPVSWIASGYQKNLSDPAVRPIRLLMEQFIYEVEKLNESPRVKNFLRAALLKTGQWALDSKSTVPTAARFRKKMVDNITNMVDGMAELRPFKDVKTISQQGSAQRVHLSPLFPKIGTPKLVLTSPPYPGVHVVYHRWQIRGRRETPAPFWIANSEDGHGLSHYTLGGRHERGLKRYFDNIYQCFSSLAQVCTGDTNIVQIIAFSDPNWQLPRYLEIMEAAGFVENMMVENRLWRRVPNRKWYAQRNGPTNSSNELVLFHKLRG